MYSTTTIVLATPRRMEEWENGCDVFCQFENYRGMPIHLMMDSYLSILFYLGEYSIRYLFIGSI